MSPDDRARGRTKKQETKERERAKKQREKERERLKKERERAKKQREKERERLKKQRERAKNQRAKAKNQRTKAKNQRANDQGARKRKSPTKPTGRAAGARAGSLRDGGSSSSSMPRSASSIAPAPIHASIPARVPPRELIEVVREAIQEIGPEGRFGPDKIFISALYDKVAKSVPMSLSAFKDWLVLQNRDQALLLGRADVVDAMDSKVLRDSEIDSLGATFNFVVDPSRGVGFRPRSDLSLGGTVREADLRAEARQAVLASRARDAIEGRSRD